MEALGIDLKLFLAQVINFLIVLFLLKKFAYNPILSILDKRRETIASGLKDSEEAEKKLGAAKAEADTILEKSYKEANEILSNAKKEAKEEAASIIAKANEQAILIRKNALEEAEATKDNALKSAKLELSNLVLLALNKIVGKEINQENKEKLTEKAISEL